MNHPYNTGPSQQYAQYNINNYGNPPNNPLTNHYNNNNNNNRQAPSSMATMRPPYVDPETQIVYHTNNPDHEGWLTKQSMWLKDWRRRYFILSGSKLFFSKDPYSTPHGMIDLSNCTTVKSADLKSRRPNSFEISTTDVTYLMYADSDREKDDWIGNVGRAIVRCSSTFVSRKEYQEGEEEEYGGGNDPYDDYNYSNNDFHNEANHPYFND